MAGYRGSHMERECVCYVSFVPVPGALMLWVVCLSLPFQTSQAAPVPAFLASGCASAYA